MKICILHRHPRSQIPETNAALEYLVADLIREKHTVHVKTFRKFNRAGEKWKRIKSALWILYAPLLVLFRDYDIIYCDDSFPFYEFLVKLSSPASYVVKRLGDLHLMYHCPREKYPFWHRLEVIAWRKTSMIIAISQPMAKYVAEEIGRKVEIVDDPIDLDNFTTKWEPARKNKKVMFHGTITKGKGIERILEAARLLPDMRFVIIGDGDARNGLEKIAGKNVEFIGWVPHSAIKDHIASANVGIAVRSDNPGNDYVITSPFLQYSAIGVPCVVSRRKVFEDMKYPWQFSTAEELAYHIKKLMKEPQSWKKKIRHKNNARKIAKDLMRLLLSLEKKSPKS